jgi:hypothetical protein
MAYHHVHVFIADNILGPSLVVCIDQTIEVLFITSDDQYIMSNTSQEGKINYFLGSTSARCLLILLVGDSGDDIHGLRVRDRRH